MIVIGSSKDGIDQMLDIGRALERRLENSTHEHASDALEDVKAAREHLTKARERVANMSPVAQQRRG